MQRCSRRASTSPVRSFVRSTSPGPRRGRGVCSPAPTFHGRVVARGRRSGRARNLVLRWRRSAAAMTAAAAAWGAGPGRRPCCSSGVRARRSGSRARGAGLSCVLNPHQEIYAFLPGTGRVSPADQRGRACVGHSCAPRSTPRRLRHRREADSQHRRTTLTFKRGVALGELTLGTMTVEAPIRVDGDVRRLELAAVGAMTAFRIDGDRVSGWFPGVAIAVRRDNKAGLDPPPPRSRAGGRSGAILTARGAEASPGPRGGPHAGATCRASAREMKRSRASPGQSSSSAPGQSCSTDWRTVRDRLVGLPLP